MRSALLAAVLAIAVAPASALEAGAQGHLGQTGLSSPVEAHEGTIRLALAERRGSSSSSSKSASKAVAARKGTKNPRILAERAGYKRVSSLVNFPAFFPGIGVLFVKPDTLPAGPFLSFDRRDRLISTIYMLPLDQMNEHRKFEADAGFEGARVDHATMYFNGGHPGVDMPHYHFVLWHVSKKNEALVAK